MNIKHIIDATKRFAQEKLSGDTTGHDWWHVYRVYRIAHVLAQQEEADLFIVSLGALLHDIADWKFHDGDEMIGPRTARRFLEQHQVNSKVIEHVCQIISDLSFKGAKVATPMQTIEGMIVQDADRLDALGAVGIARCFAYGGHNGQPMYDPAVKCTDYETFEEYKRKKTTSVNHFHEKLLLLKDRMNTKTAQAMALERHSYMQEFLDRFYREWEC